LYPEIFPELHAGCGKWGWSGSTGLFRNQEECGNGISSVIHSFFGVYGDGNKHKNKKSVISAIFLI
jgi:hypothetical protein